MTRAAAAVLLAFAAAAPLDGWSVLGPRALVAALLLLPGWVIAPALSDGRRLQAPDRVAIAFSLSLAILSLGVAPLFALGLPLDAAKYSLASLYGLAGLVMLVIGRDRLEHASADRSEWFALVGTVALLAPVVARYAGGGVDDWWDLAYVRALAERPAIDFAEPMLGTEAVHPRFAWNAWIFLQALVYDVAGGEPVTLQASAIAPIVCLASVAGIFAFARSVFVGQPSAVLAAVCVTPIWLYGTEALPYFTRVHQDKFVAALVLMPVLLSTGLDYLARPSRRRLFAVAAHGLGICSVHSLIFGVGAFGVALCALVAARSGRERRGWYTVPRPGAPTAVDLRRLALVGAAIAVLPAWQAIALRGWFAGGRVAIAVTDNPVVRAHLALDRLIAPAAAYMVVSPDAVFGGVGLVCLIGLLAAAGRRRAGDHYLLALSLAPMSLIFLPFVAAAVGKLSVPWMLYRLGWLIPQPLLMARALTAAMGSEWRAVRVVGIATVGAALLALAAPVAADRLARGMREHPYVRELEPRGTTREVYRYLSAGGSRSAVLAPVGFSNLVPALAGRPVVAFSERGTLVFARDELDAYRRIRDRAVFYSCATDATERARIARGYGVEHAVFRRRYVTAGDERAWLDRATAEGLLMAKDVSLPIACTATEGALLAGLPSGWRVVLENLDYFVVEIPPSERRPSPLERRTDGADAWTAPFELSASEPPPSSRVLASATGFPGADVHLDPPPIGFGGSDELAWAGGGALWDDGPFEVAIEVAMSVACEVDGVEIVPYLETARREVLEVRIDGQRRRVRVRDGQPFRIAVERTRRDRLQLEITSHFGLPFGLADVRLLGDPRRCDLGPSAHARARVVGQFQSIPSLLGVSETYPSAPQLVTSIARRRRDDGAVDDATTLLRRALAREDGQAAPWIEYGLLLDRAGRFEDARAAYRRARAVDSNSAWAHGCLAWAELRTSSPLRALWYSWRALQLDRRYADALTIQGLSLEQLGFADASAQALERAIALAPRRGWPYLERVRQLGSAGERAEGRELLRRYLALVPSDASALEALRVLNQEQTRSST